MKTFWNLMSIASKAMLLILFLSSCGAYLNQPTRVESARPGELTKMTSQFKELPKTSNPIVVAVYNFRDQTGQYKPSENGASWSTAVTQGATTILMKALEDSKWFIPVERENVSNLLNERKILRSSKSQMDGKKDKPLPPLYFAGIILEGGVISYDSNILTGGVGVRYFGTGGSTQYRQDRVTIYLRAISTNTGEVLKTVYVSKTILSQKVDVGIFRFVSFKRLLEAETGFTYNEPVELAVTEAVEKAVYDLVMEGLIARFWEADDIHDLDMDRRIILYNAEKSKYGEIDILGREKKNFRGNFWVSGYGLANRLKGDLVNPIIRPGAEIGFGCRINKNLGWQFSLGLNQLAAQQQFDVKYKTANVNLLYRILPNDKFSPAIHLGTSVFLDTNSQTSHWSGNVGLSMEYIVLKNTGFHFGLHYYHFLKDKIDSVENGNYNDFLLNAQVGLNFYF